MIQMSHCPGVAAMPTHGLLLPVNVIFERIGGAGSFSCHCLVICRFVALDFSVKCARRKWRQVLFFGKFQILTVRSASWFAGHRVVVGLKNLVDELTRLETCLSFPARTSKLWEQTDKAAPILTFSVSIEFS